MGDQAVFAKSNVRCRIVMREHRDDRFAVARIGKIGRLARTELEQRAASSGRPIEYGDIVSRSHEIGRHRRPHAAKSNESQLHVDSFESMVDWERGGGAMNSGPTGSLMTVFTIRSISARSTELSDQPVTPNAATT